MDENTDTIMDLWGKGSLYVPYGKEKACHLSTGILLPVLLVFSAPALFTFLVLTWEKLPDQGQWIQTPCL